MWEFKSKVMVMLWTRHVTPSSPTMREIQPPSRETPYDNFFTRKFLIYDDKVRLNDSFYCVLCVVSAGSTYCADRGNCCDSVPHVWLARTRQTCLHWLSGRDAGYDHQGTDELWQSCHHCPPPHSVMEWVVLGHSSVYTLSWRD